MAETFAALLGLFVFGTFWFWSLVGISTILMILCLEWDRIFLATITFVASVAAIIFLGNKGVIPWAIEHPYHIVAGVGVYFIIAVLWCFIKWKFYVRSINEFIQEKQLAWILNLQKKINDRFYEKRCEDYKESIRTHTLVGVATIEEWKNYVNDWEENRHQKLRNRIDYHESPYVPKPLKRPTTKAEVITFVEENKSRIISWMTYWPWSMLWTILNDPIRKIMKQIFYQIKGLLVAMAMSTFGIKEEEKPTTISKDSVTKETEKVLRGLEEKLDSEKT